MDRMYERRCCGSDVDDGTECSKCTYIGTYFDCDVYLADRGKTLMARQSSELTDVYTINARHFYKLIEEDDKCGTPGDDFPNAITDIRDVFTFDSPPKAIIMACSQMFIERIDTYFNLIDLFHEIEATQEDE